MQAIPAAGVNSFDLNRVAGMSTTALCGNGDRLRRPNKPDARDGP